MRLLLSVVVLAACGPGLAPAKFDDLAQRWGAATAAKDAKAIRKLFRDQVTNAGLWFGDASCAQFAKPGELKGPQLDDFARCLAGLGLVASTRKDALPDVQVMTYAPGFEVEARLVDGPDGVRLSWIGLSARRADEIAPTISAEALEKLRTAGSPTPPIVSTAATEHDIEIHEHAYAWFRLCLDERGTVTSARPRLATSPGAARAFGDAIKDWKFKPFVAGEKAIPVCAMIQLSDPPATGVESLPATITTAAPDVLLVAHTSFGNLVTGKFVIPPSDDEKVALAKAGQGSLVGTFLFCIDATGQVSDVKLVRATGLASYDQRIESSIRGWAFPPYTDDGKPIAPCSLLTISYRQH